MEIKKHKKIVLELERELERLQVQQQGLAHGHARERELEEKLEEREREIRELRRRRREEGPGGGYGYGEGDMRELERRNGELEGELDNLRALLEESTEEMERLREMVESRHGHGQDGNESGGGWRRHVDELECENEDLRGRIDELEEMVTRGSDEKEDLVDALEAAKLELEDVQRRREAESHERSQSRAMILEEREEREAVEEDLNAIRDKLAAAQIELQQKEDDLEMKEREIEELVAEHHRLVEEVEEQWRGENDDWRGKVEELRDVRSHPFFIVSYTNTIPYPPAGFFSLSITPVYRSLHVHCIASGCIFVGAGAQRSRIKRAQNDHLRVRNDANRAARQARGHVRELRPRGAGEGCRDRGGQSRD